MALDEELSFFGFGDEANEEDGNESDSSNDSDKENEDPANALQSSPVTPNQHNLALPPLLRRNRVRRMPPPPEIEIYVPTPAEEAATLAAHPAQIEYDDYDIENDYPGPVPYVLPGAHRISSDSILGEVTPNRTQSSSSDSD